MNELIDTHCHIHFPDYKLDSEDTYTKAISNGLVGMICVGCTPKDSKLGVEFAKTHKNAWASIGIHPHEAKKYANNTAVLADFEQWATDPKVIAIGEIGLDYFYEHSSRKDQKKLLVSQLEIAAKNKLPVIFHVREAFDDFWPIIDEYKGIRGVVHSFSSTIEDVQDVLKRDFYVGLNGIMTFTKNPEQLAAAKSVPLNRLLLETDAPFLTPAPFRGKICEPSHVVTVSEFLSELRGESLDLLCTATTNNARKLFNL